MICVPSLIEIDLLGLENIFFSIDMFFPIVALPDPQGP
jgi:hypothetical protein